MSTILLRILGFLLLASGFIVFLLPIPLGAIMMAVGAMIVYGEDPRWIRFVRVRRIAHPRFDRLLTYVTRISPAVIRQRLEKTENDHIV